MFATQMRPFQQFNELDDLDDDELWELHDEADDDDVRSHITRELARRIRYRQRHPIRPAWLTFKAVAIFAILGLLIAIVASR